jgi:hypothetical protein
MVAIAHTTIPTDKIIVMTGVGIVHITTLKIMTIKIIVVETIAIITPMTIVEGRFTEMVIHTEIRVG